MSGEDTQDDALAAAQFFNEADASKPVQKTVAPTPLGAPQTSGLGVSYRPIKKAGENQPAPTAQVAKKTVPQPVLHPGQLGVSHGPINKTANHQGQAPSSAKQTNNTTSLPAAQPGSLGVSCRPIQKKAEAPAPAPALGKLIRNQQNARTTPAKPHPLRAAMSVEDNAQPAQPPPSSSAGSKSSQQPMTGLTFRPFDNYTPTQPAQNATPTFQQPAPAPPSDMDLDPALITAELMNTAQDFSQPTQSSAGVSPSTLTPAPAFAASTAVAPAPAPSMDLDPTSQPQISKAGAQPRQQQSKKMAANTQQKSSPKPKVKSWQELERAESISLCEAVYSHEYLLPELGGPPIPAFMAPAPVSALPRALQPSTSTLPLALRPAVPFPSPQTSGLPRALQPITHTFPPSFQAPIPSTPAWITHENGWTEMVATDNEVEMDM